MRARDLARHFHASPAIGGGTHHAHKTHGPDVRSTTTSRSQLWTRVLTRSEGVNRRPRRPPGRRHGADFAGHDRCFTWSVHCEVNFPSDLVKTRAAPRKIGRRWTRPLHVGVGWYMLDAISVYRRSSTLEPYRYCMMPARAMPLHDWAIWSGDAGRWKRDTAAFTESAPSWTFPSRRSSGAATIGTTSSSAAPRYDPTPRARSGLAPSGA